MEATIERLQLLDAAVDTTIAEFEQAWEASAQFEQIHSDNAYRLGSVAVGGAGVRLGSSFQGESTMARQRNEQLIAEFGHTVVSASEARRDGSTLSERLERMAKGDTLARASIETDAFTEVTEQVCKAGGVLKVAARINKKGEIEQFGHTTYNRQKNTLQTYELDSPSLRTNTYIEGQNGFLIEELHRNGQLKNKRAVEFSLIPDDARNTLAKHGYYLREVVGIIRVTTIDAQGECEIVSVLVGGTDQDVLPDFHEGMSEQDEQRIEEQALAHRFDIQVSRRIYALLGVPNAATLSPTELLGQVLVVPEEFDHLDMVALFDSVASEMAGNGKHFFYGLTSLHDQKLKPTRADYEAHEQRSLALQAKLRQVSSEVTQELEQRRNEATTGLKASRLIREIAKNHAVRYLVQDPTADATVYGARAYVSIEKARQKIAIGDISGAEQFTHQAQEEAKATGCASAQKAKKKKDANGNDIDDMDESEEILDSSNTIRCIKCRQYVNKAEVVKKDCWECPKCNHKVDICSGKVLNEGVISSPRKTIDLAKEIREKFKNKTIQRSVILK